jgi:hypothetical protein
VRRSGALPREGVGHRFEWEAAVPAVPPRFFGLRSENQEFFLVGDDRDDVVHVLRPLGRVAAVPVVEVENIGDAKRPGVAEPRDRVRIGVDQAENVRREVWIVALREPAGIHRVYVELAARDARDLIARRAVANHAGRPCVGIDRAQNRRHTGSVDFVEPDPRDTEAAPVQFDHAAHGTAEPGDELTQPWTTDEPKRPLSVAGVLAIEIHQGIDAIWRRGAQRRKEARYAH